MDAAKFVWSLFLLAGLIVFVAVVFSRRGGRGGPGASAYGAVYDLLNEDKRNQFLGKSCVSKPKAHLFFVRTRKIVASFKTIFEAILSPNIVHASIFIRTLDIFEGNEKIFCQTRHLLFRMRSCSIKLAQRSANRFFSRCDFLSAKTPENDWSISAGLSRTPGRPCGSSRSRSAAWVWIPRC